MDLELNYNCNFSVQILQQAIPFRDYLENRLANAINFIALYSAIKEIKNSSFESQ